MNYVPTTPRRASYPYVRPSSPVSGDDPMQPDGSMRFNAPSAPRFTETYSSPAPPMTSMPYAPPAPKLSGPQMYKATHSEGWMQSLDKSRAATETQQYGASTFAAAKHAGVDDQTARNQAFDATHPSAYSTPAPSAQPQAAAPHPSTLDPKAAAAVEKYHTGLMGQAMTEYRSLDKYDPARQEVFGRYKQAREDLNTFRRQRAGLDTGTTGATAAAPAAAPASPPTATTQPSPVPYSGATPGALRVPYTGGAAPRTITAPYLRTTEYEHDSGDRDAAPPPFYSHAQPAPTSQPYASRATAASTPPYAGSPANWNAAGAAFASTGASQPYAQPTPAAPAQNTVQLTTQHASEIWNSMLRSNPGANRDELLPQFHDTLAKYGVTDQQYQGLLDHFLNEDPKLGPRVSTSINPGTNVPLSLLGSDTAIGSRGSLGMPRQSVAGPTISTPATVTTGPRTGYSPISPDTSMLADRPGPAQPRSRQQQRPTQQQGQVHPEIANAQLGDTARSKSTGTIYRMTPQGWQAVQ